MKSIPGWVILCFGVLLVFTEGFQRQRPILHQIPILRRNMDVKVVDAIEAVTAVSDTASLAQAVVPSVVQVAPVAATASAAMFSDPDSARYFLAGGTCASVSHGITVPIDVVKTRLQTEPEKYVAEEGVIGAAKRIVEREGLGTLGTGMGPTLTGYLVQGAIKFGFYEALKPAVKDFFLAHGFADEMGSLSPWLKIAALVLASASAELLGSSALAPFEAARIRMVSQPDFAKGIVEALSKLRDEEGVEALFNGLPAILVKQIPYTVVSLTAFETVSGRLYAALPDMGVEDISAYRFPVTLLAATIGAFVSCFASQPGDTLLSAVNAAARPKANRKAQTGGSTPPSGREDGGGAVAIMISAAQELGPAGLFRGVRARLVHCTAIVVSQLLIYDQIKAALGIAAAGAH